LRVESSFWHTTENNFLEIALFEWRELFADQRATHHWKKLVTNQDAFLSALLQNLSINEHEFDAYVKEMRVYRDKFIAQTDEQNEAQMPDLSIAIISCQQLYQSLLDDGNDGNVFPNAPPSAESYFLEHQAQGKEAFALRRLRH